MMSESPPKVIFQRICPELYLTECIYQLVSESPIPHESVDLYFIKTCVKNKLTDFCGD